MAERFAIERELGRGGMGVVYLARDLLRGERVALKRLGAEADPEALRREFRAALSLRHPVIVRAHELGHDAEGPFLTMEWVDGDDLSHYAGKVEPSRVARWAVLIADALEYARRRGLVHGDIKPQNLLVPRADPDSIKLLDLGLVGRAGERATGGTVAYLAPEVLAGEASDARSDLFSLGCVLFELLSGRSAFTGVDRAQTPALPEWTTAGLAELVPRLLSLRPQDRPGRPADVPLLLDVPDLRLPLPEGDLVGRDEVLSAVSPGRILLIAAEEGMGATRLLSEVLALSEYRGEEQPFTSDRGRPDRARLVAEAAAGRAVVAVFRPADVPDIEGAKRFELGSLSEQDTSLLVASRLPLEVHAVSLVGRWVYRESGGSPALAVDALECLRDARILRRGPLGLECDDDTLAGFRAPGLGTGQAARTIERLSPAARAAASRLAVVADETVHPELLAARLVEEVDDGHRFRSESLRRALIGQLSAVELRALHHGAAERLMRTPSPRPRALALHLVAAGRDVEAGAWLLRAARAERETGERRESLRLFQLAVERLGDLDRAIALLELGDEELLAGRPEEALASWRAARAGDSRVAARAWASEAELHASRKLHTAARAAVREVQRNATDAVDLARALALLGRIHAQEGHFAPARRHLLAALVRFESIGDAIGQARTAIALGNVHFLANRYDDALEAYQHSLKVAEAVGARHLRATAFQNLGNIYAYHRRSERSARETLSEAVRAAVEDRDGARLARSLAALAAVEMDCGDLDAARRHLDRAIRLHSELGDRSASARCRLLLGEMLAIRGEFEAGRAVLTLALDYAREHSDRPMQIACLDELGRLALDFSKPGLAQSYLEEALGLLSEEASDVAGEASVRASLIVALRSMGQIERASELAEPLTNLTVGTPEVLSRVGRALAELDVHRGLLLAASQRLHEDVLGLRGSRYPLDLARSLLTLATVQAMCDKPEESLGSFEEARVLFERYGAKVGIARAILGKARQRASSIGRLGERSRKMHEVS